MTRRLEIRPTTIYWLEDHRPETLRRWPNGKPFYCGKTVFSPQKRFEQHRYQASMSPNRNLSKRILACDIHVRVRTMEVVPVGADWEARERWWIYTLRLLWSDCLNVASGGQGSSGTIHSRQSRSNMRRGQRNSKVRRLNRNIKKYYASLTYEERRQQAREYEKEIKAGWIASGRSWPPAPL